MELITLREAAITLGVKDVDTAAKWLADNGIAVHMICRVRKVFAVDVAIALDRLYVRELRRKFPNDWEYRYQIVAKDPAVCRLVIAEIRENFCNATTTVQPLSVSDEKLIQKLNK
ncbi:MAG: hypothetical protein IBJ09_11720 [Bacteroidia bacterium]|nr:hypothetical protein [Bacteroidia bacterium]